MSKAKSTSTRGPKRAIVDVSSHNERIRDAHFCFVSPQIQYQHLPIAGTGAPKRCPWCGSRDVNVEIEDHRGPGEDKPRFGAFAVCEGCGCRGRQADGSSEGEDGTVHGLMVEAARLWNERKGGEA